MKGIHIAFDGEIDGIDGYPATEIGEYIDNNEDAFVITFEGSDGKTFIAYETDESEEASYTRFATLKNITGGGVSVFNDTLENTDLHLVFDFLLDEYVIVQEA